MYYTYPVAVPLAFIIDDEVTAYIMLKQDQEHQRVPEDIQKIIDAGDFQAAAKRMDPVLDIASYFERDEAAEVLEEKYVDFGIASEFEGDVTYLDKDFQRVHNESYTNGYIVYVKPFNEPEFCKAAYTSIDEIIAEFKKVLAPVGAFPSDFDWASKLVKITGIHEKEK